MPHLIASEVARSCGGTLVGDGSAGAGAIVADSREAGPRTAFAAIRGGAAFIGDALAAGAPFVISEDTRSVPSGATAVVVGDVVRALGDIARAASASLGARVVGVTGSTGKTLTKDLVAAALGVRYRVHASPRSYNAEIGVPLVVLSCPDDAEVLVVELAARHPGEIAELAAIVRPAIGVVTGIGTAHLSEFGSREAIAATKAELPAALPPNGLAVLPAADAFLARLVDATTARVTTVGPGGSVRYSARGIDAQGRTHARVWLGREAVEVTLPLPGRALVRNAGFALAVASELGVEATAAAPALASAVTSAWRMEVEPIGRLVCVNDAWNANPTSTSAALRTTEELSGDAPRWAVLGEMAELGPISSAEHLRIGRLAATLGYERVIAVGAAEEIARGAGEVGTAVEDAEAAAEIVASRAPAGAFVLVKGSRVAGLETFGELVAGRLGVARSGR